MSKAARSYFKAKGVDLTSPKSLFYSDTRAEFFVRGTRADLDIIEKLFQDFAPSPGTASFFTRRFRVDESTFMPQARAALGLTETNPTAPQAVTKTLVAFFASKGVDLSLPKRVFFNDQSGTLIIRAPVSDLDKCQEAISKLEGNTPFSALAEAARAQIQIQANFIEVPEAEATAFCARFAATNAPGFPNWCVTLSKAQATEQLALWKSGRAEFLASPAITTLSGRKNTLTLMGPTLTTQFFLGPTVRYTNELGGILYFTNQVSLGPEVAITPIVGAGRPTIYMDVAARFPEFVGYDNPNTVLTLGAQLPQGSVLVPTVLPRFRVHEVGATANVRDGETLVIGGPATDDISAPNDPVPFLPDVPVLGRLIQRGPRSTARMRLFILLTPTLIDSAGNPVHPAR